MVTQMTSSQTNIESNFAIDSRFLLINKTTIIIPTDYIHIKILNSLNHKDFKHVGSELTDENFSKVTHRLQPGRIYDIQIIQLREPLWPQECVEFLKVNHFLLVGAQGELLLWQIKKEVFPLDKWVLSFDEEFALHRDTTINYSFIPFIYRKSNGKSTFSLAFFNRLRHANINYIIGFKEHS